MYKYGNVTANTSAAKKGDSIIITAVANSGYILESVTAVDSLGKELKLTEKDGKYTFTMPESDVRVKASFVKEKAKGFIDIDDNEYYAKAVSWAVEKGITNGTTDITFSPDLECGRAQIVTFLWRAAGSPEPSTAQSFTDVAADSYYAKAVSWAVEQGITKGTLDTTFSPDDICTRAQAVTFLFRALKGEAKGVSSFTDVPSDSYYAEAVAWAYENGITSGTTETTFSPDDVCTRAQIVTFLFRAMAL